jgi:hypothetical protein
LGYVWDKAGITRDKAGQNNRTQLEPMIPLAPIVDWLKWIQVFKLYFFFWNATPPAFQLSKQTLNKIKHDLFKRVLFG